MNKNKWISDKIGILIKEGKPREQAVAIAYSMWERGDHMQQGGFKYDRSFNTQGIPYTSVNPSLTTSSFEMYNNYANQLGEALPQAPILATGQFNPNNLNSLQSNFKDQYSAENITKQAVKGVMESDVTPAVDNTQYNDWVKYNILNPYGQGMDLNTSLAYTGQQFGQGNTGMGIAGAGLSALKGVRSFLSGYGSGRGQQNVERQMRDKLYNSDENLYQQGGIRIAQQGLGEEEELYGQNQSNNYADLIQQAELQGIAEGADRIYNELQSAPNQGQGLFNGESVAGRAPYQPPMSPNGESTFVPTTVEKTDSNSARDVWTEKTGLPWSEAKRLGYTDGTAKNNTKLLQELKDPRFKKENLRTKPFTAPVEQAKAQVKSAKEAVEAYKKTQKPTIPSDDYHYNWVEDRHKNDYLDTRTRSQKIKDALNNQLKTFGYELAFQQGGAIIDNTYVPKPKMYREAPKRELSTEELSALAHQKRGQGSLDWIGNQGYVKSHDPILNKTGTLTPNQIAELQKYMDNSNVLETLYQGLPNAGLMFGDEYSAAGLPITSKLRQQGGYSEGQEYDLTEEEIHDLLSKGYKIRYK